MITNLDDVLHTFEAGPETPGWNEALQYLLSDQAPDDIRQAMRQAVQHVFKAAGMGPVGYVDEDKPVCRIEDVAAGLGITEDEVRAHVRQMETEHGERLLHDDDEVMLVQ